MGQTSRGGEEMKKRVHGEMGEEPRAKRRRFVEGITDRYSEFGEGMGPEYFDWEGKIEEYRREIEREEMERMITME